MGNLELKLDSLKHLLCKTNLYNKLIHNKNYTNINTKKYKENFNSLRNSIKGEIYQTEELLRAKGVHNPRENFSYAEITNYLRNEAELKPLKAKLNEISKDMFRESEILELNTLNRFDNPPEWLFPTSTFNAKSDTTIIKLLLGGITLRSLIQYIWFCFCKESKFENIPNCFAHYCNFSNNVDGLFIGLLMNNERVKQTLDSWNNKPKITQRYPILKEAIEAHIEGKFYLSVSTLIPQVEGLLRDSLQSMGKNADFNSMRPEDMKRATSTLKDAWESEFPDLPEATLLLGSLPNVVGDFYEEYTPAQSKLYRHGVCHGLQTDFGSRKNSTRLILVLDRIIFFYAMS